MAPLPPGRPAPPRPRLKPERIDDGVRRAELTGSIAELAALGMLTHLPSDAELARTRATLGDGWAVVREATLPNLETFQLLLGFLAWAATREGKGTPPGVFMQVAVTLAPPSPPPGPVHDGAGLPAGEHTGAVAPPSPMPPSSMPPSSSFAPDGALSEAP